MDVRLICSYFVLAVTVNQQKVDNGQRMGNPYFWCKSTRNTVQELLEIIHFLHIYGIHILASTFSSINGASRILNLNLNSSVADHLLLCKHSVSYDDFSILTRENKKCLLELKESLLIKIDKPSLNRNITSAPL